MSKALFGIGGLRFWDECEVRLREQFVERSVLLVRDVLTNLNRAWTFHRIEGPCLHPRSSVSNEYTSRDVYEVQGGLCLRPETTPSTYEYAVAMMKGVGKEWMPPVCVWQVGKSFRVESNDGASAAKYRYNEFYQQEFQCIYSVDTKADYAGVLIDEVCKLVGVYTGLESGVYESDRLPSYSRRTLDIEVVVGGGRVEIASCSLRSDFPKVRGKGYVVLEIALGLDRIVDVMV